MKKDNILTKIANGLKRAIEFVVDVLLFVPRFLINGIKGFFKKEAEAEELVEEFGDEEEAVEENQAEPVKESSETESAVEKSVEEQKETTAESTVETSEQTNPVNVEVKQKPVEENKSADNKTVVEVKVTAAADQPEHTTIETKTPIEQSSGQQEEKTEEAKSTPVAMVGDVVDTNTGKVINKLPQQQPEKKEEKANKSMPIFGKTDPKCKDLENKLIKDYGVAYRYSQKNLAADTAKAVKEFAIDLLKLYGLKENYNGFDAPVKDDEALARNIISWMANAEYPMLSQESVQFFNSCLNQELYMGQLQHRLDTCAKYIDYYKKKNYPEQLQMEIQEYMKQQSAKENQQLKDMLLNNNNNPYGGVSFA